MVLHTIGTDLKYHLHVHALVTLGGINPSGQWLCLKENVRSFPLERLEIYLELFSSST